MKAAIAALLLASLALAALARPAKPDTNHFNDTPKSDDAAAAAVPPAERVEREHLLAGTQGLDESEAATLVAAHREWRRGVRGNATDPDIDPETLDTMRKQGARHGKVAQYKKIETKESKRTR